MKNPLYFPAILWVCRQSRRIIGEGRPEVTGFGANRVGYVKGLILLLVLLCPAALYGADVVLVWDANTELDLAGYRVYIGTYSRNYGTPIDAGKTTTYTVRNLGPGTYYFAVTAYNNTSESGFSNEVSTTITAPDIAPPVISGVAAGSITTSAATITWFTDENSDSQVEYGINPAFGNSTSLNTGLVTSHSQGLSGLTSGTLYYYRAKSRDAAGNLAVSASFAFTTVVPCSYSVLPTSQTFGAASGSGTISVTAPGGCAWSAATNAAWVALSAGASGSGNGIVSYTVAANSSGSPRIGTMTVAGQTITISQQGSSCDINSDIVVNALDLQMLVNVILGMAPCPGNCDVNRDGRVDALDLQTLGNVVLGVRSCP